MRIMVLGDIFGQPGMKAVVNKLPEIIKKKEINFVVINAEKIKENQTDKDGKLVILYASDKDAQHSYIAAAKDKGYEVLLLNSPIVSHLLQKLETSKDNVSFVRVDGDDVNNLIKKDEEQISKLSDRGPMIS